MADEKDNTFGATVIKSRAVNFLLTKLRCKDTSGRVSRTVDSSNEINVIRTVNQACFKIVL